MKPILWIPIPMGMTFRMVRMTSQAIQTKIRTPTVTESVMTRTLMMMVMAFRMKKKRKMEPIPKTQIPMVMELMMEQKKKWAQIPTILILTAMVLMMEMMISPMIPMKTKTLTMMVKVIILIPTMTGMAFLMKKRRKMEPIPKIQIPMETE